MSSTEGGMAARVLLREQKIFRRRPQVQLFAPAPPPQPITSAKVFFLAHGICLLSPGLVEATRKTGGLSPDDKDDRREESVGGQVLLAHGASSSGRPPNDIWPHHQMLGSCDLSHSLIFRRARRWVLDLVATGRGAFFLFKFPLRYSKTGQLGASPTDRWTGSENSGQYREY